MRFLALALALAAAAAHADSSNAIIRLLNSRASGSPRGYAEAAAEVARDAEAGKPLQQFVLALVATEPDAPPAARMTAERRKEYLDQSRGRIRALAEQKDNALAWYLLSLEENDLKMLRRAADGGNIQALNAWGTITLTQALSNHGVKTNDIGRILTKSFGYFKRAAAEKDPNGIYNVGMCYLNGYGVDRDPDKAYECFRTAAEAGHPEAINNLGGFYRDGVVVDRDPVAAVRWFRRSAEMENPYGELNYGLALQRGEGVAPDAARAVALFRDASAKGSPEAMNALGMCLYRGEGAGKDEASAVALYRRAASLGYPPAMENLAAAYELGFGGIPKDSAMCKVWKIRALAARGDRNAAAWLIQNGHSLR